MIIKNIDRIKRVIKNPKKIIPFVASKGILNWMPDEQYLKLMGYGLLGEKLDIKNPKSFNEKLQWLKLYDRKPEYTILVDKYEVRKYISMNIGKEYLIPLIGVWDNVEEIDFAKLPNKFVLKCTHDSGSVFICTDKSKLDIEKLKIKIKKALKRNYYYIGREWPYKNVKPRIVCEEFISDKNSTPDDYKVLCFNGKAKLIGVHIDRFGNHCLDNYDRDWNKTEVAKDGPMSEFVYEKPKEFEKMIELSEKIALNMSHVRVDWFIVNEKLYFGEITFYEAAGFDHFDNKEDNYLLGSWIDLPRKI
ncbi:ATP-grasp fold amidoligase family protein [Clostridium perfringens]|uniref:ATP-grasp fold amidoligase family protein n=1 Tax=Clostridium perfringens TaxID=1502 RepID=UPI001ABB8330|nr:ATP-grasp fold amidoligase family protein [Clostridium perfringens]MBO3335130.1 glycosyl transferase [Clostridium perfringens]